MFDKLLYWKRRKAGQRGQGELPKPNEWSSTQPFPIKSSKQPTKKALLKNTKRARKQNAQINNQRVEK